LVEVGKILIVRERKSGVQLRAGVETLGCWAAGFGVLPDGL